MKSYAVQNLFPDDPWERCDEVYLPNEDGRAAKEKYKEALKLNVNKRLYQWCKLEFVVLSKMRGKKLLEMPVVS